MTSSAACCALSDPSGLPAKRFADFSPAPSLDWLEPLSEERFRVADLPHFGILPRAKDSNVPFSLTDRPSPYLLAPRMRLVHDSTKGLEWDDIMWHLARWLTRHLDNPDLLLRLAKRGGPLHRELAALIERRVDELALLKDKGDSVALARILADAPDAIPRPRMRTLWRLLASGQVHTPLDSLTLFDWTERFRREGLTTTLRLELRGKLTPRVVLRQPFRFPPELLDEDEPDEVTEPVEWEVVLTANHVHYALGELPDDEQWTAASPQLLSDFGSLLRDALDLMRELGGADDTSDFSYIQQPSIARGVLDPPSASLSQVRMAKEDGHRYTGDRREPRTRIHRRGQRIPSSLPGNPPVAAAHHLSRPARRSNPRVQHLLRVSGALTRLSAQHHGRTHALPL